MSRDRCIHTNIVSVPGIKLNEYIGSGTPVCISNFLNVHGPDADKADLADAMIPIQSFLDRIPLPVFYKNIEGKYSGCNESFMKFIGGSDPDISSQTETGKNDQNVPDQICDNEKQLLQTGGARVCESIVKTNNGDIKYALINKAALTDAMGSICGLLGMISDITTHRQLKDALNTSAGSTGASREDHFQELTSIKQSLFDENTKRRHLEKQLAQASRKLDEYISSNAENHAGMSEILKYLQDHNTEIEDSLIANIKNLVMPYMLKLTKKRTSSDYLDCLDMIESRLSEIMVSLSDNLSSEQMAFTPEEIRIADLIREGKQDREIMEILNISIGTVRARRKNIRRKLGMQGDRTSLRSRLLFLNKY